MRHEEHSFIAQAVLAVRIGLITLAEAITVGLCIAVVISFCAIGCMMHKRDAYTSHNVKGFRAPVASHLSAN